MSVSEDVIRAFATWVVTTLAGDSRTPLQPHRVATELTDFYDPDGPVNSETIRKIIRYGECLIGGMPLPVVPRPTEVTMRRLMVAICAAKGLEPADEAARLGLLMRSESDLEGSEPPEESEAFPLIHSFYDCRRPFAHVRGSLHSVPGSIEIVSTAAILPAMKPNEYLVIAIKSVSAKVLRNIAAALDDLESQSYSAINIIYDVADGTRAAVKRAAREILRAHVVLPESITVLSVGEFLSRLFDNEVAKRTLREQYAKLSAASATIDPFSDEGYLVIESVCGTSGSEAGCAAFGDNLDEQLRQILKADHPVRCMVRGQFGAGKSTAIYRAAAALIREAEQPANSDSYESFLQTPRPLIIAAATVLGGGSILERLAEALRIWYALPIFVDGDRAAAAATFISQLIRKGVIVLFVDSLDESPALSQADRIAQLLDTLPGYRVDQQGTAANSLNDDRSKYVLSYRPEIFQSGRVEDRLLYLNRFAMEDLKDYTYALTLMGPREGLRSPFSADVLGRTEADDPASIVRVAEWLVQSLSDSPLFRSMSTLGGFDVQALRRPADEFAHREGERPVFLYELYTKFSELSRLWEGREKERDSSRASAGASVGSDRRARLDGCTHIALAMLGREDCSRHRGPGRSSDSGMRVNYALPADDLRRVTEQNLLNTERVRDQLDHGRQKEEMQLAAWYDARVGMMLVVDPDQGSSDRHGRWRFPNIAMEALFTARGLHHMLDTFERGHVDPASLEYPFEPHAVLGPLCRSLIDDRMRGAVMLLAGKLLAEVEDPQAFPDDVLAALREASRSSDSQNAAANCISEHPVLALNIATICIWLKDLLEFGIFDADLSQIPLSGLSLRGWNWPGLDTSDAAPIARNLNVRDSILEDAQLRGFNLTGEPRLYGILDRPARVQLVAMPIPIDVKADDPAADRWSVIPGGVFAAPTFHADRSGSAATNRTDRKRHIRDMRGRTREGGRDTARSVLIRREGDERPRTRDIFVPTFLMQQTPTTNAQFLVYLQSNGSADGWPQEERRRTSNPWYLYDWSHFEFLFGSDLKQWPNKQLAEALRVLGGRDFQDQGELLELVSTWLGRRQNRQESSRSLPAADPIEARGWLFSRAGPFGCATERGVIEVLGGRPELLALFKNVLKLFENWLHRPLTRINWRVATRFARYYGWSLPSEVEFQIAALWWEEIASAHDFPEEALREVEPGFAGGPELWRAIEAQLHAYQPNINFVSPPWKETPSLSDIQFWRPDDEDQSIYNDSFLQLAEAYRRSWKGEADFIETAMPPAFLTGVIGTWTRDVYDPSWPLGFAELTLPGVAAAALFNPVNHGLVDLQRAGAAKGELPVPTVGDLSEEPLRAIRGRGLRFGWPQGSEYRFGQQETNVNPDVGLRCVKHLHLVVP